MVINSYPGNDLILAALTMLASEFKKAGIPLIVGGGFSQYIKAHLFEKARSPRYEKQLLQRSTKDIDIFLTSEIITNSELIEKIKLILRDNDFQVKTKYFQYVKRYDCDGIKKDVQIDFLSQPVEDKDMGKVIIRKPRIKPKDVENFHAFFHPEAEVIGINLIKAEDFVQAAAKDKLKNVYLPSALSFIILKLYAFRDRKDDESKDYGRHHAYDIFSSLLEMDSLDWSNSKLQKKFLLGKTVFCEAQSIIEECFTEESLIGIIRLKENKLYYRDKEVFDQYINNFISDLRELFF